MAGRGSWSKSTYCKKPHTNGTTLMLDYYIIWTV
nr:MAG TPA: Polycystin-2, Polycystin-1 complex, polycystic kidney disease.6A [Caudoviricetes sp.]